MYTQSDEAYRPSEKPKSPPETCRSFEELKRRIDDVPDWTPDQMTERVYLDALVEPSDHMISLAKAMTASRPLGVHLIRGE